MNKMNFNSARALKKALLEFGIPIRYGGDAIKTQWIDAKERREKQSSFLKNNPKCIKYRSLPKSDEFKKKISIVNKGKPGIKGSSNNAWLGGKPNWAKGRRFTTKKRLKIIIEKGAKCEDCGDSNIENLTLHHIIPWRISKDHSLNNLKVLCKKCHFNQPHDIR